MTKDSTVPPITRRSFLTQASLLGLIAWNPSLLLSCEDEKAFSGSGDPPFSVWEEVLEALKSSPDHFLAQRELALSSGDPIKMHAFVSGLTLMPSDPNYFEKIGSGMLYGTQEALRCGMATPREKAEILKDMYLEAGFEARVVFETIPMEESDAKKILFSQQPLRYEPAITEKMFRQWLRELNIENPDAEVIPVDVEKESGALSDRLINILTDENSAKEKKIKFYYRENSVPTVAFVFNGETQYAHLFDPSVPFGQLHPKNVSKNPPDAGEPRNFDKEIEIRVSGRRASDLKEEIELVKGTWRSRDLFGSQLKLQFLNNLSFEEQVYSTISQIQTFTPALVIQNVNQPKEWHEERSILGEAINLEGTKVLEVSNIQEALEGPGSSENLERVSTLEVKATVKGYPRVSLKVYPRDADGQIVERLHPNAFKLKDNGISVKGLVENNVVAPRILLLYDTSFSMPKDYYGEQMDSFVKDLSASIKKSHPEAIVKPQKTGSNIYSALYKACLTTNDVIVYATDGHNGDTFNPNDVPVYTEGPPCIFLNVHENLAKQFAQLAENTGSTVLPARDQVATIQEIVRIVDELDFPPYTINYQSFEKDQPHEIIVSLGDSQQTASDTFSFLATEGKENQLIGLYLEIKIGRERPLIRTLAGWDSKLRFQPAKATQWADAVHEMLLGNATLAFESAGASLSIRASEYLKALLYDRPWYTALQKNEIEKAFTELKKGRYTYPPVLLSMMQPLYGASSTESITYPTGIRIGVLKFKPALFTEESKISFDYLPTSKYQSLTRDGLGYFRMTMEKTAQMALLENTHFQKSTLSILEKSPLRLNRTVTGSDRSAFRKQTEDFSFWQENIFRGGNLKLFDSTLKEKAFWEIDPKFGELYGILEDGTGGGGSGQLEQLRELDRVVKGYERIVAMMNYGMAATGAGGLALGIVAAYSIALVKLYAGATEAIIIMDAIGLDDAAKEALLELGCNVYKNIVYGGLGPVGTILDGVENLMTIMGKSVSFLSCP